MFRSAPETTPHKASAYLGDYEFTEEHNVDIPESNERPLFMFLCVQQFLKTSERVETRDSDSDTPNKLSWNPLHVSRWGTSRT